MRVGLRAIDASEHMQRGRRGEAAGRIDLLVGCDREARGGPAGPHVDPVRSDRRTRALPPARGPLCYAGPSATQPRPRRWRRRTVRPIRWLDVEPSEAVTRHATSFAPSSANVSRQTPSKSAGAASGAGGTSRSESRYSVNSSVLGEDVASFIGRVAGFWGEARTDRRGRDRRPRSLRRRSPGPFP